MCVNASEYAPDYYVQICLRPRLSDLVLKSEFLKHVSVHDFDRPESPLCSGHKRIKLLQKIQSYGSFKPLGVTNDRLRQWPFCCIELAKCDQRRSFIVAANVTF